MIEGLLCLLVIFFKKIFNMEYATFIFFDLLCFWFVHYLVILFGIRWCELS